eukprot:GFUD01003502.1.p1 GENE.GFUD01003502.1~~GFUD01003502.1.p1  ORF type:complete len:627 (+),score=134.00 GFUD01003502.1:172-2052(+)
MVLTWHASDSELGGIHRHCFKCFNLKKCNRDEDACGVSECPVGCGWMFHSCKEEEHLLLCPMVRVECINSSLGCGIMLTRKELVKHLPVCPASIVACTQEWNRWPLHCKERYKTVPFRQRNPRAERGQLDYELAIRDQRMVGEFYKVPRKTKLALRNNLTRRFPALPLPPHTVRKANLTDQSLLSLREAVKFEVSDETSLGITSTYGVAKMFLKNQEVQAKRWKDDVDQAILRTGQPVPKRYWEYPELERGNIHRHCAYCHNSKCTKRNNLLSVDDDYPDEEVWTQCCQVVNCPWECGAVYHHCKAFEHKMICPQYEEEGEFDWMQRDRMKGVSRSKKAKAPPPLKEFPDLLTGPTLCPPKPSRAGVVPKPPPPPPDLSTTMRFDIKVETVTRLQQKPRAMYTFLCGQELRRDQWEGHCKNVHSEIHGGLNNWIEARCPLSSYGCSFSTRRLYPGVDSRASVVYSQDTMSFGIRPPPVELKPSKRGGKSLTDLPLELLQVIFSYLDSWSLSNIALANNLLREVASSLLDEKGCVALQWEKIDTRGVGGKGGWIVGYKRWFFSNYFCPVNHWGVNADGAVSEHLKNCPYNIKAEHRKPDVKSEGWTDFMEALGVRMKQKRESEWFIE